jgi:hypothetical protein
MTDQPGFSFAFLIVVGLAGTGFAVLALARRPLFAVDRIVAATLALVFSAVTTAVPSDIRTWIIRADSLDPGRGP